MYIGMTNDMDKHGNGNIHVLRHMNRNTNLEMGVNKMDSTNHFISKICTRYRVKYIVKKMYTI
jgi:hypothetical protein